MTRTVVEDPMRSIKNAIMLPDALKVILSIRLDI